MNLGRRSFLSFKAIKIAGTIINGAKSVEIPGMFGIETGSAKINIKIANTLPRKTDTIWPISARSVWGKSISKFSNKVEVRIWGFNFASSNRNYIVDLVTICDFAMLGEIICALQFYWRAPKAHQPQFHQFQGQL